MGGFLLRLKNWWQVADKTQKLVTVFGGGSLIVLLLATFMIASRPKMVLLFSNLTPEDTGNVALELENMGIPVSFDDHGNVMVPSEKRARAQASLAMKGKLPKVASQSSMNALKDVNLMGSQAVQNEQLKAITEGELAQSIQYFEGVDSANVQITPAIDSPFESDKKPAQANVTVAEKAGSIVGEDQARAMANMVASAVPGLDTTRVTIFTRTGRQLWDGQDMENGSARASNKLEMEKLEAKKRREALQDALNRMLGSGNAIAMVDVTLDTDEVTEKSHIENPGKPIVSKTIEENGTSGASPQAATSGMTSNQPAISTDTSTAAGGASYSATQKATESAVDVTDKSIKRGVGEVKSMSVTVLVNQTDEIKIDPTNPADPVVKLANSFLGAKGATDTENFKAEVVTYPFDKSQAKAAAAAAAASASSGRMQQILSILPIVALLIVGFMVVRSIGKLAARPLPPQMAAALAGGGVGGPSLPMGLDGSVALAPGGSHALPAGSPTVMLPEIVKQKALEAGITEEQLLAAMEEAGDAGISVDDIPSIKSRINVPLEQIKKMANEKPETVAMLIKSWLLEEGMRR
jgi:flagellar M-ring protein FliF